MAVADSRSSLIDFQFPPKHKRHQLNDSLLPQSKNNALHALSALLDQRRPKSSSRDQHIIMNTRTRSGHAQPDRVERGGLLAAFKDGASGNASKSSRSSSTVHDTEVESCLQLAASLDDDTWDDLEAEASEPSHSQHSSPTKRRKIDEPSPASAYGSSNGRFRPYVDSQQRQTGNLSAAPRRSVGRFEIPEDERAGLNLQDGHVGPPSTPARYGMSSDTIETSPSSATAYHRTSPTTHHNQGFAALQVHSSPPQHAFKPPIAPQTPGPTPFTPARSQTGRNGMAPFSSSPVAPSSSSNPYAHALGGTQTQTTTSSSVKLSPSLVEMESHVHVVLRDGLERAQRKWSKERQGLLRKLEAKEKTIKCLRDRLASVTTPSRP
ncbi:hypothetical protein V8E36_004254 [Tilletia maclaganii]